jgi:predicted dehydrogenase
MIRLGVLGCGDVAFRTYLPGLAALRGQVAVAACTDPVGERAVNFADKVSGLLQEPCVVYRTLENMLKAPGLDGVLNLSPAPYHFETTSKILAAGLNCFSEKPIAGTLEEARALMRLADERGVLLLCAPATMASSRFRWLKEILDAGLLGRPTLAIGQMANMGPALWREYMGDPAVFYTDKVGPVLDTGVYLLHAVTGLFGPARTVSAVGGVAIPERISTIPARYGEQIPVTAADHMLLHLTWDGPTFAQLLSSFATPRTTAPVLEVHGEKGSICIPDIPTWYDLEKPVDLLLLDPSREGGHEAWAKAGPADIGPVRQPIQSGPVHFIDVLAGREQPILTAAHATHVLEIIRAAEQSAANGGAPVELEGF